MPSKLHPAHLHHHLRHRLLSRITPTSRSPVCPISHRTKSPQFRPFRIWRYPSAPTHRALFSPFSHPVATHGSVFRTQLPHTGIQVCTLPGLVMGVERQSTLRSDSEGCVRCSDAAQWKSHGKGPVVSKVGSTSCTEANATTLNDVYKLNEKLGTYRCPRFVSESLSLLSSKISWGGGGFMLAVTTYLHNYFFYPAP